MGMRREGDHRAGLHAPTLNQVRRLAPAEHGLPIPSPINRSSYQTSLPPTSERANDAGDLLNAPLLGPRRVDRLIDGDRHIKDFVHLVSLGIPIG